MAPVSDDDIRWLIALAESEDLAELEVAEGEARVLVRRPGPPAPAVNSIPPRPGAPFAVPEPAPGLVAVRAPMAGVFYRSSAPDSPPFVEEGDEVQEGETVALVEAMKLYNEVESPTSGRVTRILVADGSRVAADQDLMYLRPAE